MYRGSCSSEQITSVLVGFIVEDFASESSTEPFGSVARSIDARLVERPGIPYVL